MGKGILLLAALFTAFVGQVSAGHAQSKPRSKIVSGVETLAYPSVGALLYLRSGAFRSECSGTLIGCSTFITAAHCFFDDLGNREPKQRYRVFLQNAGIFEVAGYDIHPSYVHKQYPSDIAIVRLSQAVKGIEPSRLYRTKVAIDTPAKIVGFGKTDAEHFNGGVKRTGPIKVKSCAVHNPPLDDDYFVCWLPDVFNEQAGTCNADSGGPLFIGDPPTLAAITTGGYRFDYNNSERYDCRQGDMPYNANLTLPAHRDWIEKVTAGDLGSKACGLFDPVGGRLTKSTGAKRLELTLSGRDDLTFTVDPGVLRLVVTLNGEDESSQPDASRPQPSFLPNDFDLYIGPGDKPDAGAASCPKKEPGVFSACILDNPKSGKWWVLIRTQTGAGIAQLSITQYIRKGKL
jgi:hypothetical protein